MRRGLYELLRGPLNLNPKLELLDRRVENQLLNVLSREERMDSQISRSLPPLVEGKLRGSLRLVVSEVFWFETNPGDVTVVASWWGERDNAQFRPRDNSIGIERTNEDISQVYAIRTNLLLFEDYIKNCNAIELIVIAENTHEIVGRGCVQELSKIFSYERYSQFIPILSSDGHKMGKLYVSLELTCSTKLSNTKSYQMETIKYGEKENKDVLLFDIDNLQYDEKIPIKFYSNTDNIEETKSDKIYTNDTYRSVLKTKRQEFQEPRKNVNRLVINKLIPQIVARAQCLREAILKETCKEDSLQIKKSCKEDSLILNKILSENGLPFNSLSENKAKFYNYILGMDMIPSEEKKILNMLRSMSSNSNFIDLTSKIITTDKHNNKDTELNKDLPVQLESTENALEDKKTTSTELQGIHLDHVNSIRIFIESFTLTHAGYRRAKSTRLQYNSSLSLTYFIQYDMTFKPIKQINTKPSKETKFLRTCAKKQVGQVVNFNSEGIYNISRHNIQKNLVLRFKVFVKHCNQKVPTELGFGSVNISDITSITNLSSIQCITIINKGIKIGDLKVIIELGCDFIHFGKECIDTVISKKENFSISNEKVLTSLNDNQYKTATGTHSSKSNRKVSSAKQLERLTNNNNKNIIVTKDIAEHQEKSLDNKKIDVCSLESDTEDKISLHGLIYVAEGRDLSESNTYLICRAFWREDKAISQVCNNTTNPFYHFFQIIPLVHGAELLERVKDNYIIIEVYNQQNSGTDNLLGIAKLPVHQLYDVYSDPVGLPHLLLSKYPVISVDDWVNINDPVSGKLCGKLLALVALGTAEQIALLEVSRGLKNISEISRMDHSYRYVSDNTNNATSGQENLQFNIPEVSHFNSDGSIRSNNFAYHVYNVSNEDSASNYKTQESQTNITNLKDTSSEKPTQDHTLKETIPSEQLTLRNLVDCLTNVLHNNKNNQFSQSTQIEANRVDEGEMHKKLCLNMLDSNSLTDVSDSCNPKNDLRLPIEMYRSVGVGAEYVEDLDQQQNNVYNNPSNSSLTEKSVQEIKSNINNSFFRCIVEIECALHLPMIEESNKLVEPSTYITFKNVTNNLDSTDELNSYIATNVFPYSCNPKWNWRCDVNLSTDLLLNNQKRLILKIWHLINPDAYKDINLKRDIVIGFSAIDLSVLTAGFPTVSGWFHIMDFSGKCNGQIKINITPLDNLSSLRKFIPADIINLSQPNWPHLSNEPDTNTELNVACEKLSNANQNNDECVQNCKLNVDNGLEDVSMSFLSLSLKKKLTELNEITQRLQSRLRDVTNTAFEDEFDNDFDIVDLNSENENINDGGIEMTQYLQSTVSEYSNNEISQIPRQYEIQKNDQNVYDEKQTTSITSSNSNLHFESMYNKNTAISSKATDVEYLNSNKHFSQHPDCYHNQYQNQYSSMHNYLSNTNAEYPVQGTKAHINHLLDKLSFLPPRSSSEVTLPIRKSILELFTSLREHKNHLQDKKQDKDGRDISTSTMLVQSDNQQDVSSNTTDFTSKPIIEENISVEASRNKISTLILEELVTEENDDSATCDELTTYLITCNIRHMDLDNIFNPLLYQHLISDLQLTAAVSLEGESVEQLDNRYARNFDMAMRDSNSDHSKEKNTLFQNGVQLKSQATVSELDKKELFDLTSSNISEDVDNSIDMTVIYKSGENHLTSATNNAESIAAASLDRLSVQAEVEIKDCCSNLSEVSIPGVSRQAPEGGNPVEEVKTSTASKWSNDTQDISTDN